MKITKIQILNFLGIGAFKPGKLGKLNKIKGGNGTGKSSVLKAITEAFKSSGIDPNMIKVNSDKAEIMIEIDGRIKIDRRITSSANNVKVVVDGEPVAGPQKWLNNIIGPLNFNPVDFFLAKPKERRAILLSAIHFNIDQAGLIEVLGDGPVPIDLGRFDYSKHGLELLDEIQKAVYEKRHEQNIEVTRLRKAIEQDKKDIPSTLDKEKFKNFDIKQAMKQLQDGRDSLQRHEGELSQLESLRRLASDSKARIEKLESELVLAKSNLAEIQSEGKALKEQVNSFTRPDVESVQAAVDIFHDNQKLIHKLEEIERREDEAEKAAEVHVTLDAFYKKLSNEIPKLVLQKVKLPIKGLVIKDDDILINKVAIDKLATSEQIKFAVEIARALAGELKVICVDRFESLDKDARKAFENEAECDDFEYFMTQVTDGDLSLEVSKEQVVNCGCVKPEAATPETGDAGF